MLLTLCLLKEEKKGFAYITGQVPGSFRRSDTQVVQTDLAGFRLVLLPLLLIFNLERQI